MASKRGEYKIVIEGQNYTFLPRIPLVKPNFVINHPREIGKLPVKLKLSLDGQPIVYFNNVLKGLINHSSYVQDKLKAAIKAKDPVLELKFLSGTIHEPYWIKFMAGYISPEFFQNINNIDLVQLIAACHCYGLKETFLMSLLDLKSYLDNKTLLPMIYYCLTVLDWKRLAANYFHQIGGLHFVHIPKWKLKTFRTFRKFNTDLNKGTTRLMKLVQTNPKKAYNLICRDGRAWEPPMYRMFDRGVVVAEYEPHKAHKCPSHRCSPGVPFGYDCKKEFVNE